MANDGTQRRRLAETLDEAEWEWLKAHARRDGLIIVAPGLDLLDAGEAIADDDTERVQTWIQSGALAKPTAEQLKEWDQSPSRRFLSVVVQPYVLIQERVIH